jgi:hypothetical protein
MFFNFMACQAFNFWKFDFSFLPCPISIYNSYIKNIILLGGLALSNLSINYLNLFCIWSKTKRLNDTVFNLDYPLLVFFILTRSSIKPANDLYLCSLGFHCCLLSFLRSKSWKILVDDLFSCINPTILLEFL